LRVRVKACFPERRREHRQSRLPAVSPYGSHHFATSQPKPRRAPARHARRSPFPLRRFAPANDNSR
jgi:hypothetical protein